MFMWSVLKIFDLSAVALGQVKWNYSSMSTVQVIKPEISGSWPRWQVADSDCYVGSCLAVVAEISIVDLITWTMNLPLILQNDNETSDEMTTLPTLLLGRNYSLNVTPYFSPRSSSSPSVLSSQLDDIRKVTRLDSLHAYWRGLNCSIFEEQTSFVSWGHYHLKAKQRPFVLRTKQSLEVPVLSDPEVWLHCLWRTVQIYWLARWRPLISGNCCWPDQLTESCGLFSNTKPNKQDAGSRQLSQPQCGPLFWMSIDKLSGSCFVSD